MDSLNKECIKSDELELLILRKLPTQADFEKVEQHLNQCSKCKNLYSKLRTFYRLLFYQLQQPVANNVFGLTYNIKRDDLMVAAILLKPQLLDEKPGERHFTSELILSTINSDQVEFDELDFLPLRNDEVLIRAIQSINTNETTLFLFAEDKKLYSEVILKLPEIDESFKSDKKGKIEVGRRDIGNFENRAIMLIPNH